VLVAAEDDVSGQKQRSADKGDNTTHSILHGRFNTRE
jgi:hypothetical protein